jgi:hypothetical protein
MMKIDLHAHPKLGYFLAEYFRSMFDNFPSFCDLQSAAREVEHMDDGGMYNVIIRVINIYDYFLLL